MRCRCDAEVDRDAVPAHRARHNAIDPGLLRTVQEGEVTFDRSDRLPRSFEARMGVEVEVAWFETLLGQLSGE